VNSLCTPASSELPSTGGNADAPHAGGGASGDAGTPFTSGAGAAEKFGVGGTMNAGADPSDGGTMGSSRGDGEAGGALAPNDGLGSAGGAGYGSANCGRGRSAAAVVSIGRGISGGRKGEGGGEASEGMLEPADGDIR